MSKKIKHLIPVLALLSLVMFISPAPASARVHFGVYVGPPAYPYPAYPAYPYSYDPYGYPYAYGAAPYGYGYGVYGYPHYYRHGWEHERHEWREHHERGYYRGGHGDRYRRR